MSEGGREARRRRCNRDGAPGVLTGMRAAIPVLLIPLVSALAPVAPLSADEVPLPRPRPVPQVTAGPDTAPAPEDYRPGIYQTACPAMISGQVVAKMLPPIADGQCQLTSPLALSAVRVNGREVPISGDVTTDCGMATQLPLWLADIDGRMTANGGAALKSVAVGTSYACRPVNHVTGAKLSFHGLGDALDIVSFTRVDGETVMVGTDWGDGTDDKGRLLRFAHDAACSRFTTVLGPEADAEHKDHLHLDLGCHGKTCTARLCQ